MKKFLSMIVCVFMVLIASCSSPGVQNSSKALIEAKLADVLLQSGEPRNIVLSVNLSDVEMNQVLHALDTYQLVRNRWKFSVENPLQAIININLLESDFTNLESEYKIAHDVVQAHWNEYSPAQQLLLAHYHARAVMLGDSIRTLISAQNKQQALSTALDLGLTIAQILAV